MKNSSVRFFSILLVVLLLLFPLTLPSYAVEYDSLFDEVRNCTDDDATKMESRIWDVFQSDPKSFLTALAEEVYYDENYLHFDLDVGNKCSELLADYHKNAGTEADYLIFLFSLYPNDPYDTTFKNEKSILGSLFIDAPIPENCADEALIDAMLTAMPVIDGAYAEHLDTLLYRSFMQAPQQMLTILTERYPELSDHVVISLVIEGEWSDPEAFSALVASLPNDKTLSDAARAIAEKLDSAVNAQPEPTTEPETTPETEPETEETPVPETTDPPVSTEPDPPPASEPMTIVEKTTVAPLVWALVGIAAVTIIVCILVTIKRKKK